MYCYSLRIYGRRNVILYADNILLSTYSISRSQTATSYAKDPGGCVYLDNSIRCVSYNTITCRCKEQCLVD